MTQVREICRRRAEQTIRDGLIGLQGQVVALIAELHVEGLLSAEDILHAAAQPRGLEHPRVVAAIDFAMEIASSNPSVAMARADGANSRIMDQSA